MRVAAAAVAAIGRVRRRVTNQLTASVVARAAATAMPSDSSSACARAWSRWWARSGGTGPTARCRWSRNRPGATTTATTTRVTAPAITIRAWVAHSRVDLQRAEAAQARCRVRAAGAAQHGPHPGDQLPRGERLGQVVIGTHGQADQLVDLVALGGEHDDVGVAEGPDPPADLDPVDAGQHQVQH